MSYLRTKINPLLLAIKEGDKSKRQALYDETYYHLKKVAGHYAVNKDDWEDILMDAYAKAFRYIYSFNEKADGYNWLCKIVQNVANDYNRKVVVTEALENAESELVITMSPGIETKADLNQELLKLSARDQKILYLRFWEGLSLEKVGEIVGVSKSYVHKRECQLLKLLKNNLSKE